MPRIAPDAVAGIGGMLLVAALTVAQGWLVASQGRGLPSPCLLLLTLPGVLAAHLERRAGRPHTEAEAGLRAGLITAHLAAPLLIILLVIAVATTDWERYAGQVGTEVAGVVRDAALPATMLLAVVAAVVAYAGCGLAGVLGALLYAGVRNMVK